MKIVVANWKMNPVSLNEAKKLALGNNKIARLSRNTRLVICPPLTWLSDLSKIVKKPLELGAQNSFWTNQGPFTGEVSPLMLKNIGCAWVIIGHSERRGYLQETDEMVNKKTFAALSAGLNVVLAVGEQSRETSKAMVDAILEQQLKLALKDLKQKLLSRLVVVYEPVWAIGTGLSAKPDDALQASLVIRKVIAKQYGVSAANKMRILYGGSVDKKNVSNFINQRGIEGILVGGASLNLGGFSELIRQIK
ncbi:triose-phosphate isomerase [Candidatus Parcubacteria bacterium]|nr:MAG: triose-phosphate isomerase [Candidatus Parcubacteria bacterium]